MQHERFFMDVNEIKKFIRDNKKGLIVGAVAALLIRSLLG